MAGDEQAREVCNRDNLRRRARGSGMHGDKRSAMARKNTKAPLGSDAGGGIRA